jgi:hypothetical protein
MAGSSWGGYYTTLMVGLDPRLKAGSCLFGCGGLYLGSAWRSGLPKDQAWLDHWRATLDPATRLLLGPVLTKAMTWRGPLGSAFVSHLVGSKASTMRSMGDPRAWALELLGFPVGTTKPSSKEVKAKFRDRLREAHPDHGGDEMKAAVSIDDLGEARRILLANS